MKKFLNSCARIEPIGRDNEDNTYWEFDCLPDYIVRETSSKINIDDLIMNSKKTKRTVNKSTFWYKYSLKTNELTDLIKFLRINYTANLNIITKLKAYKKNQATTQQIDGFLIKNAEKAESPAKAEIEQKFNIRRSTRISSKQEITKNDSGDSDNEPEVIIDDSKKSYFDAYNHLEPIDALFNVNIFYAFN